MMRWESHMIGKLWWQENRKLILRCPSHKWWAMLLMMIMWIEHILVYTRFVRQQQQHRRQRHKKIIEMRRHATLTCRVVDLRSSYADSRSFPWPNPNPDLNPLRPNGLSVYQPCQYYCRHRCRHLLHLHRRCRLWRSNRLVSLPPINSIDDWPIVSNVMIENRINHRVKRHHRWIVHSTNELLIRLLNRLDIADCQLISCCCLQKWNQIIMIIAKIAHCKIK